MIDPLSFSPATGVTATTLAAGPAFDPDRAAGATLLDALTLGAPVGAPVGVPLREVAGGVARALGQGADPVSAARLEGATLDFAREAKAFAIGHAPAGPGAIREALDAALDAGAAQADRLSPILSGPAERITTIFEGATAHLRTI